MPIIRLDRFFSSQEILSRKELKPFIKSGRIRINNAVATRQDSQINTDTDVISLDSAIIEYKPFVYILLNKPQGVVSATDDKINKTVLDLVPRELYRSDLFPAGRLDKDSTGLVLITNNGELAHKILSPKNHVGKIYQVRLDNSITDSDIASLECGITLADGYNCLPCKILIVEDGFTPLLSVELCEGKYHQIKRMFGVVGCGVLSLNRTQIGNWTLDSSIPLGQCKEIMHKDMISSLLDLTVDFS